MIDVRTGTLTFDGWSVGPGTDEPTFATASALHVERTQRDMGDYSHHSLRGLTLGKALFHATFTFHAERLERVSLAMPTGSAGWDAWSEEAEQRRKRDHDEWLEAQLGPGPYDYSWGSVCSKYYPQSGESTITVSYP